MDLLFLSLFILNIVLTLVDASVAYHRAPRYLMLMNRDPEGAASGARKLISLLPLVVALYVTLDCYAYSLRHGGYLAGLTLFLLGDIVVQYMIARKGESCEE